MSNRKTLKALKATKKDERQFKPKPWLRKPDEEKKVQGYYYVKAKHKDHVTNEINKLLNQLS